MTDFAGFKHGGTEFPLNPSPARTLLRDADPALFYILEYFASVIETHLGARLVAETAGMEWIEAAVAMTLPLNPEPFLVTSHLKFPLLAAYRKSDTFKDLGQRKLTVTMLEVAYVLPPLAADEAEKILPILKAVCAVIDNRTEQGWDPAYTPTTPNGTPGEKVWAAARAGLSRIGVEGAVYGGYQPTEQLYFPAVVLAIRSEERSEAKIVELDLLTGITAAVDMKDEDGTTVADVSAAVYNEAPVLVSISPATGTKAGGTPVTITGTGFVVGTPYRAVFSGADASNVVATSSTTLECVTPAHAAYPTFAADLYVFDQDNGASNKLASAYTFTTP